MLIDTSAQERCPRLECSAYPRDLGKPWTEYAKCDRGDNSGADKKADAVDNADEEHAWNRILPRHLPIEQVEMLDDLFVLVFRSHCLQYIAGKS